MVKGLMAEKTGQRHQLNPKQQADCRQRDTHTLSNWLSSLGKGRHLHGLSMATSAGQAEPHLLMLKYPSE